MNNVMEIGGHRAVIQFDPEIGMFRGEFLGLNGGADFYADSVAGLQQEGKLPSVYSWRCVPKRALIP